MNTKNKFDNLKKGIFAGTLIIAAISIIITFQNCSSDPASFTVPNAALALSGAEMITVIPASGEQCPGGGKQYIVFLDKNGNGARDIGESALSQQVVCNGAPGATGATGSTGATGANGLSSLFSMNRVTVSEELCKSGSGVQLSSGLDLNQNQTLDSTEITSTEILCDGEDGAPGANGLAGSNGHSLVSVVSAAPDGLCSAGGTLITMALDIQDSGFYSAVDPNQQSVVICNGATGAAGMNAPPTPYTPVQAIMPCGNSVAFKEVLLLLSSGQILAAFSDSISGLNTRLTLLSDGNFIDTDDSNCAFSITTASDGHSRSISWQGQVQQTWQMTP